MRDPPLAGKTAVVTGAGRGIGRETSRLLAAAGCRLVLNSRDPDRLERTRTLVAEEGGTAIAVPGDVGDPDVAKELVVRALRCYGRADILINNAGVTMRGGFAELSPEVVERVVRTNLLGSIYPTRYALPELARRGGSVVFVSSLAGLHGVPHASLYSVTKMALTALAQSIRAEAGLGVHVGVAYVGFTANDPDKTYLAADGAPRPLTRTSRVSQTHVARRILGMVRRRRRYAVLTSYGKLLAAVERLLPWVVDGLMTHIARRPERLYR